MPIIIQHDNADQEFNDFEQNIGITYFDIYGDTPIYLAKVPKQISEGDIFNVYSFYNKNSPETFKSGCEFKGDLKQSLELHTKWISSIN